MALAERLRYHQAHSAPIMKELKGWLQEQLEKREVEPNSPMGKPSHICSSTGSP
jgi:hypothetical protein